MTGLRAELRIADPPNCQVAAVTEADRAASGVTWGGDGERVVEEATLPAGADPDGMEAVFSDGDRSVYRFERPADQTCVCEVVEANGAPVRDVRAEDGSLVVTVYVRDTEALRTVVAGLRAVTDGVSLVRLTRSSSLDSGRDLVFVNRTALTDRQDEVIATAHEMGYFNRPRDANATEVAATLDISRATFAEHLAAAQSKILDAVLG
ncbi:MAG: putative DNA binding protein [Natronomonas sp.]|jgi:predicted DNA binding protein